MSMKALTMAARAEIAREESNANLEAALSKMRGGEEPDTVDLPSGLRVRLKKPGIASMLGGNPFATEGVDAQDQDELLKMLKVSRGQ